MTRLAFLIICCCAARFAAAQGQPIVKYYDSVWAITTKDSAYFQTQFFPLDKGYQVMSYKTKNNTLFSRSVYSDTLYTKPLGPHVRFHDNGKVQDSTVFYDDGMIRTTYYYFPSGQRRARYDYDRNTKKETSEGWDEQGQPIKDFIILREAAFPGGKEAWVNFLGSNLQTKVPLKKGAPKGTYQVVVQFVVDTKGAVTNVKATTNHGYGMEEEAMRVIRKSPRWEPMILMGKTEKAYRRQPITFVVSEK